MTETTNLAYTSYNHPREPHCCGCWNIISEHGGDYYLECNECGVKRSIVPLMEADDAK